MTTRAERLQEATFRAYLRTGSAKRAAKQLGISEGTARRRLASYYSRLGVDNAAQAAYRLDRPPDWQPQK